MKKWGEITELIINLLRARTFVALYTTWARPRFASKLSTCLSSASWNASFSSMTKKTKKYYNCSLALILMHKWSIKSINMQRRRTNHKYLTSRNLGLRTITSWTYCMINRMKIIKIRILCSMDYRGSEFLTKSNILGLQIIFRLLFSRYPPIAKFASRTRRVRNLRLRNSRRLLLQNKLRKIPRKKMKPQRYQKWSLFQTLTKLSTSTMSQFLVFPRMKTTKRMLKVKRSKKLYKNSSKGKKTRRKSNPTSVF